MEEVKEMFVKAVFFFTTGVILASLFAWSMMQGVLIHFSGNDVVAFYYYFVGWISGIAAFSLYWQAKSLFHYAKISN